VHLKKLRRAEGGAKIVGVFRVKNHDFTPKNHFFPLDPSLHPMCIHFVQETIDATVWEGSSPGLKVEKNINAPGMYQWRI
jgi:hypothetical protein